jgi:hypothetical protein
MPLHDWSDRAGWEEVHHLWIADLLRWVRPRLPQGFHAHLGTAPALSVGAPGSRPDFHVRTRPDEGAEPGASAAWPGEGEEPDVEVAVATIDPSIALMVERDGRLVAAVELVSPRNKDRPTARDTYLTRYLGYLLNGVNLVLVDVHARPIGFSFADRLAEALSVEQPPCPAPVAVSYRVGEPAATGGRLLAIWRRPMVVGEEIPAIPLPLTVEVSIALDLERTYARAAEEA